MRMISKADALKEESKDKLYEGTAAIISDEIKGEWIMKVIEGTYTVRLKCKLTNPTSEPQGEFKVMINEAEKEGKLIESNTTILEFNAIKVATGQIILKRISG